MKAFDAKWQACAARARRATQPDGPAPFGFAQRVAARALPTGTTPVQIAWDRQAARWLAFAVAILVLCAVVELPHLQDSLPLEPGIENAVAQLVWSL